MSDLTTAILDALTATGREACLQRAERIAREIVAYGGMDPAAAALANDKAQALLSDLLAYRAALAELADPRVHIVRLRQEADDLEAGADPLWAQGAQFAGRAAFRRLQGDTDLADIFQRKSEASEQRAANLQADAFAKRLEATQMMASMARRQDGLEALEIIAA